MSNQRGATLVEMLVSIGIVAIILSAAMTIVYLLGQQMNSAQVASERDKIFANIVAQVRSQAALQMVNFAPPSVSTDDILDVTTLPLAWSPQYFGPAAGCTECMGRAGYVVRPIETYSGVYVVSVRLYDIPKDTKYDFQFLMVAK